jgi:hypothetical protein
MSGPTIVVDPDDVSVPIPGWQPRRVIEHLDEEFPEDADPMPCVYQGRPCVVFGMWDMAEDWSGEFVNPNLHPFIIFNRETTKEVSVQEFWRLVRQVHGLN